ncbi:hypothetical protein L0156_16045 [bacterium]|nr:hypothetical protein [bacterium]
MTREHHPMFRRIFLALFAFFITFSLYAQETIQKSRLSELYPTLEAKEYALRTAKVIKSKRLGTGITNPLKLTMQDGDTQFYAVFKDVHVRKPGMTKLKGGVELDFKDSWQFDVAAYELDKLLGLNMIPVTIERRYEGENGAMVWWIENAMTEGQRKEKGLEPPDIDAWNRALYKVRLFDNLVYNIDRNLGNLLITPEWKVWMIDHSRCFKSMENLKAKSDLARFSLSFIQALKKLDEAQVQDRLGKYLTTYEIRSMMKRRDAIVQEFEKARVAQGDSILFP